MLIMDKIYCTYKMSNLSPVRRKKKDENSKYQLNKNYGEKSDNATVLESTKHKQVTLLS